MSGTDRLAPAPYLIVHAPELPDDGALDRAVDALDEVERAQANRYRLADARRRFVWRRYLRRHVLAQALDTAPRNLVFAALCPRCGSSVHGKPFLPDAPQLHFSAAQSGRHTVVATGAAPFGIDIQVPSLELREAAVFTPAEEAVLGADPPHGDRRRAVLWARKEAYLKAIGMGLSIDPVKLDARAQGFADGVFGLIGAPGQASLSVASWTLSDAAVVAIAGSGAQPVQFDEIVGVNSTTDRLVITTVKAVGHEGEMGLIYASSGASGGSGLSRGR